MTNINTALRVSHNKNQPARLLPCSGAESPNAGRELRVYGECLCVGVEVQWAEVAGRSEYPCNRDGPGNLSIKKRLNT